MDIYAQSEYVIVLLLVISPNYKLSIQFLEFTEGIN